jgi:hypothetical protein
MKQNIAFVLWLLSMTLCVSAGVTGVFSHGNLVFVAIFTVFYFVTPYFFAVMTQVKDERVSWGEYRKSFVVWFGITMIVLAIIGIVYLFAYYSFVS